MDQMTTEDFLTASTESSKPDLTVLYACTVLIYAQIAATMITIIVNPVTVVAMVWSKMLKKTATNLFIVSLCVSDFLLGLGMLLLKVAHAALLLDVKNVLVRVTSWFAATLGCIAFCSSLLHVILIGADRAIATVLPMKHRFLMSIGRSIIILGVMWFLICVLNITPIIVLLWDKKPDEIGILVFPPAIFPENYTKHYTTPYILFCIAGSAVLYGVVIRFYFKATKKINKNTSASELKSQKMTRMIITIVSILVVLNGPIITIGAFTPPQQYILEAYNWHNLICEISNLLVILPTFVNNFVYAWHLEEFRNAYKKLFRSIKGSNSVVSSSG